MPPERDGASDAAAHNQRGRALQAMGRPVEAMACYERALELEPKRIEIHDNLGASFAEAHATLGAAFWMLGLPDRAMAQFAIAVAVDPAFADTYGHLGNAYTESGRIDDAAAAFAKAVELSPRSGWLYRRWAGSRRVTAADAPFAAMQRLAQDAETLPVAEQIELHFGLAKAYDDVADFERASAHLLAGNALKRAAIAYDEAAMLATFEGVERTFSQRFVDERRSAAEASPLPVFIVGMPRSGTSLVEQILASHSSVFGAGEIADFERSVHALRATHGIAAAFPEAASAFTPELLRRLGADYVERLAKIAPSYARITNKMPGNILFAGLIHLALPNARIIHVRREPLDTCLSCFTKLFSGSQPFTYDRGELGRYYRSYAALMAHWRRVLPPESMLEVRYEALVADLEGETRRMLAYCGLAWEDACARFYETPRIVRTTSALQVRQPIFAGSIGRHRHYEALLRPLAQALYGGC